jgi:hypothetical protein
MAAAEEPLDGFGEVCEVLVPLVGESAGSLHRAEGVQLGPADRFRLIGSVPPGQRWAYQPGEQVRCIIKVLKPSEAHWLAVERYGAESMVRRFGGRMETVWTVLGGLGFMSGAAFLVFWLLAWTGHVPPGGPLAVSGGGMVLVTGLLVLRAAVGKAAQRERGKWARSNVQVGRLSVFAMGTFFCAIGAGILGSPWLPKQFGIGMIAVAMASFALGCFCATLDGRRARAEAALKSPMSKAPNSALHLTAVTPADCRVQGPRAAERD